MQSVSQQCSDARSKINELQQQINNIEDTARNEAFKASQKYFAAMQHLINRDSSTPTPAASHTHHTRSASQQQQLRTSHSTLLAPTTPKHAAKQ